MDKVTLPSIPWIRTLDNDVIGDILYYFSTYHGREMLSLVTRKLNEKYNEFIQKHPGFSGQIDLIAHSLGGLICYEILYHKRLQEKSKKDGVDLKKLLGQTEVERYRHLPELEFTPNRLFSLGSPLGSTCVFRNLSLSEFTISSGFHNIFHPYDPFGYRTEPLIDDTYSDIPAVPIENCPVHQQWLDFDRFGTTRRQSFSGNVTDLGKGLIGGVAAAPFILSTSFYRMAKTTVSLPFSSAKSTSSNTKHHHHSHNISTQSHSTMSSAFSRESSVQADARSLRNPDIEGGLASEKQKQCKRKAHKLRRQFTHTIPAVLKSVFTHKNANGVRALETIDGKPDQTSSIQRTQSPECDMPASPDSTASAGNSSTSSSQVSDDLASHIRQIFITSEAQTAQQRLAVSQGLPRASHAISHQPLGQRIYSAKTIPFGNFAEDKHMHRNQIDGLLAPSLLALEASGQNANDCSKDRGSSTRRQSLAVGSVSATITSTTKVSVRRHQSYPLNMYSVERSSTHNNTTTFTARAPESESPTSAETMTEQQEPVAVGESASANDGEEDSSSLHRSDQDDESVATHLPTLPYNERMDYIIPFSKGHLQNEYWLGLQAHFSYWTSKDLVYHILHHMILSPQ